MILTADGKIVGGAFVKIVENNERFALPDPSILSNVSW